MSATEIYLCPTCHHSSSMYWFHITPGLVGALVKFKRAVVRKGENSVHTRADMDGTPNELSKSEYANWTILRFHGLVAKDRSAGAGYWLLTRRGNAFLVGEEAIPARVQTLNNHVVDHDPVHVMVSEVLGSVPIFEDQHDRELMPVELAQGSLLL